MRGSRALTLIFLLLFMSWNARAEVHFDDEHMITLPGFDPNHAERERAQFQSLDQALFSGMLAPQPLRVSFDRLLHFPHDLLQKLAETKTLLERVLASQEFYQAVIDHSYDNRNMFVDNRGYSNAEIYELIQLGKETLSQQIDYIMNLELQAYYEDNNVVGYTYRNAPMIYVNRKFYDSYTPAQISRNLMHEWLHKIGFSHDRNPTARRPFSVPYGVGAIMQRLARQ